MLRQLYQETLTVTAASTLGSLLLAQGVVNQAFQEFWASRMLIPDAGSMQICLQVFLVDAFLEQYPSKLLSWIECAPDSCDQAVRLIYEERQKNTKESTVASVGLN